MAGTALGPKVGQGHGWAEDHPGAPAPNAIIPATATPVATRASHAEFIGMIRRSAVVSALRSPFGSPFGLISIPEIDLPSRFSLVRMLIEAAGQYQRRHRGGACGYAAGQGPAGAGTADSVPGCAAGGGRQRPLGRYPALRPVPGGFRPEPSRGGNAQSAVIRHISVVRFI
jgi:hypothetical protein